METSARLLGIYVAAQPSELPHAVDCIRALAGRGLEGDRYAKAAGTFSVNPGKRDVTLIEMEALQAYERESGKKLSAAESRRNLLTAGVRLNDLVGREFQIGAVRLRGLRLCEPCTHLARLTHPEALPGLVHRGGLVAELLCGGELRVGDGISERYASTCNRVSLTSSRPCSPTSRLSSNKEPTRTSDGLGSGGVASVG